MGDWQPIETAPKDGTFLLVCRQYDADGERIPNDSFGIFCQVAAWWEEDGGWMVYCSLVREPRLHFEPTHWRHLGRPEVTP